MPYSFCWRIIQIQWPYFRNVRNKHHCLLTRARGVHPLKMLLKKSCHISIEHQYFLKIQKVTEPWQFRGSVAGWILKRMLIFKGDMTTFLRQLQKNVIFYTENIPTSKDTDQIVIPLCALFVYGHVFWRVITPMCDHPGAPRSQITPNHAAITSWRASVMWRQSALRRLSASSNLLDQEHHHQDQLWRC